MFNGYVISALIVCLALLLIWRRQRLKLTDKRIRTQAGQGGSSHFTSGGVQQREANRLMTYLVGKFGHSMTTADGAISFFERLSEGIGRYRQRIKLLEHEVSVLRAGVHLDQDWVRETITRGGRMIQEAEKSLLADSDYYPFAQEIHLSGIIEGLKNFHSSLKNQIDVKGLARIGHLLEEPWIHDLLRAEAICNAFYPTIGGWHPMRLGLSLTANALREHLKNEGLQIDYVRLLTPIRGDECQIGRDEQMGLRRLGPATRVISGLTSGLGGDGPIVLDCIRFGRRSRHEGNTNPSRVVVYNPAEWS